MLDLNGIHRILKDLCAAELQRSRRGSTAELQSPLDWFQQWGPGTVLLDRHRVEGQICLELDSIERLTISSAINQFFRLHQWGVEDNLLRQKTLGDLAELIAEVVLDPADPWKSLTLESSGSTGEPKQSLHTRDALAAEVGSWAHMLPQARRVLSLVPTHHLYGLIWTVLWPASVNLEAIDARAWSPGAWQRQLQPGDVIVAVPIQWSNLLRSIGAIPQGVTGISSAGRLEAQLWQAAASQGLSRMVEVYGSTETGGVATRQASAQPFELASHWQLKVSGNFDALAGMLPDTIEFEGEKSFRIVGRKDGAVKVAGILVQVTEVEQVLLQLADVLDCRVRLSSAEAGARLEALIATQLPQAAYPEFESRIQRQLASRLPSAAQPRSFKIVDRLPMNEMGKVAQW